MDQRIIWHYTEILLQYLGLHISYNTICYTKKRDMGILSHIDLMFYSLCCLMHFLTYTLRTNCFAFDKLLLIRLAIYWLFAEYYLTHLLLFFLFFAYLDFAYRERAAVANYLMTTMRHCCKKGTFKIIISCYNHIPLGHSDNYS